MHLTAQHRVIKALHTLVLLRKGYTRLANRHRNNAQARYSSSHSSVDYQLEPGFFTLRLHVNGRCHILKIKIKIPCLRVETNVKLL